MSKRGIRITLQFLLFLALGFWTLHFIDSPLFLDTPRLLWLSPAIAVAAAVAFGMTAYKMARWFWLAAAALYLAISFFARPFADVGRESVMAGHLMGIRAKLAEYHATNKKFPPTLDSVDVPPETLQLRLYPHHELTSSVLVIDGKTLKDAPPDTGTWAYRPSDGKVFINCSHEKHHGGAKPWSAL